jgi:hypothetical protein
MEGSPERDAKLRAFARRLTRCWKFIVNPEDILLSKMLRMGYRGIGCCSRLPSPWGGRGYGILRRPKGYTVLREGVSLRAPVTLRRFVQGERNCPLADVFRCSSNTPLARWGLSGHHARLRAMARNGPDCPMAKYVQGERPSVFKWIRWAATEGRTRERE